VETVYFRAFYYNLRMIHDVDAIYDQGVFRPLAPLVLPEGARVHLRIEQEKHDGAVATAGARVYSPRLAHLEQAADFEMEVREVPDAGL
jgi:predicted DNA-binding antitoxin AbrB/MazE fold protein